MKPDIVFTIDANYIKHFCVALTSLLENNKLQFGNIYLIKDFCYHHNLTIALSFFKKKYNKNIICLELDAQIINDFKITHHISKATYFRLLIADILPNTIENIVFFDSDLIINGNLKEITHLNFSSESKNELSNSYYIYAVDHKFPEEEFLRLQKLGFSGNKYFNAGVMVINLQKWRDENVSRKSIDFAIKYKDDLLWWDQDVLNLVFENNWGELDFKYNAFNLIQKGKDNYKIIHYTGSSKPWQFMNKHPYKNLYWKYLKKTPFYNSVLFDYYFGIIRKIPSAVINRIVRTGMRKQQSI